MTVFKIGEICVLQNLINSPEFNGAECEIVGALRNRKTRNIATGEVTTAMRYEILLAGGEVIGTEPHHLRRKSPPASTADEREYEALMDRLMNRKEQTV